MKRTLFLVIILISTVLYASILPPDYFFQELATQNKSLQSILIKQDREIITQGAPSQTIQETIKTKKPGLFKWTANINGQEEVKILGKTEAFMGAAEHPQAVPLTSVLTPLETVLIYSQSGKIESILKQIKVDVTKQGYELFEVQGEKKIEKQPEVRIGDPKENRIYVSSAEKTTLDAMVWNNQKYKFKYNQDKLSYYPIEIEIYDGDTLKEKIRVRSVTLNPKISETEFEPK